MPDPTLTYPVTPLIPSENRMMGLLPRDDLPGEYCNLFHDKPAIDIIPVTEWPALIQQGITMRPEVPWIYDQDGVGSCAAESACGGLDLIRSISGFPTVKFNPWGVYHFTGGGGDNGSTLSANLRYLRDQGAIPESLWPRSHGYRPAPSAEALAAARSYRILEYYEISSWVEFGTALLHRFPVYWGNTGHAMLAVQLLNTTQFLYRNSWAESWGDKGFGIANSSSIYWSHGAYCICNAIFETSA